MNLGRVTGLIENLTYDLRWGFYCLGKVTKKPLVFTLCRQRVL